MGGGARLVGGRPGSRPRAAGQEDRPAAAAATELTRSWFILVALDLYREKIVRIRLEVPHCHVGRLSPGLSPHPTPGGRPPGAALPPSPGQ